MSGTIRSAAPLHLRAAAEMEHLRAQQAPLSGALNDEGFTQLFYGFANTEKAFPWQVLRQALLSGRGTRLSDRERCEMLLHLVNGGSLDAAAWDRFVGAPLDPPAPSPVRIPNAVAESLRAALACVIEDPETAIEKMGRNIAVIRNRHVITIPEIDVKGCRWVKKAEDVVAQTPGDALIYALELFVDPKRRLGKRLRRCAWTKCSRFAFVGRPIGPGQPPKYYCNSTCKREGTKDYERTRKARYRSKHS